MMKKLLLVLVVTVFVAASSYSQTEKEIARPSLSVGVEAGLPLGDFKDGWKFGIGGSLKGALPVATDLDITLTAGYMSFSGKTVGALKVPAVNFIPVKAGVRYRFNGGLYVEPQLGYTRISSKGEKSDGAFTYAANLGYMFSPQVDLGVRYEAFSKQSTTTSFIGARLAYSFTL